MVDGAVFDSCLVDVDCDDGPEYSRTKMAKARLPWLCCECHRTIHVGERYECDEAVYEGEWATHRTCSTCARIRSSLCQGGFVYGDLWDQIMEHYCIGDDYKVDQEAVAAMVPESYLHPAAHRCRTEHVQDCGHCDEWWCEDNTSEAARKYRERYPETNPCGGVPNASV